MIFIRVYRQTWKLQNNDNKESICNCTHEGTLLISLAISSRNYVTASSDLMLFFFYLLASLSFELSTSKPKESSSGSYYMVGCLENISFL